MTEYVKAFDHANTTDNEEEVVTLTSNETEKLHIKAFRIYSETNDGLLSWYNDRELIGTHPTGVATIQNYIEYPVNLDLPIGATFKLTLKNKVSGTNASIVGVVIYEIK